MENTPFSLSPKSPRDPAWTRYPALYEDEHLLAIDKPAGVLAHPNHRGKPPARCAFEGAYDMERRCFSTPAGKLWLMHRLDQETSGVLLGAKSAEVALLLRGAFENGKIQKIYAALVRGRVKPLEGRWKDHLVKSPSPGMVRSRAIPGRPPNAELRYQVHPFPPGPRWLPSLRAELSLLEIHLLTGKTHQIRIQAAARRHFVAGDRVYGDFSWNRRLHQEISLSRLFLHARELSFQHPKTLGKVRIRSPLPPELAACLERLGIQAPKGFQIVQ